MTEIEELKKAASESREHARTEELKKYLFDLIDEVQQLQKRERDAGIIYVLAWSTWMVASFLHQYMMSSIAETIFILALIYNAFRVILVQKKQGEFLGAVKALEILGLFPPDEDGNGVKRRKKSVWSYGVDLVKSWTMKKKAVQEKMYAPA